MRRYPPSTVVYICSYLTTLILLRVRSAVYCWLLCSLVVFTPSLHTTLHFWTPLSPVPGSPAIYGCLIYCRLLPTYYLDYCVTARFPTPADSYTWFPYLAGQLLHLTHGLLRSWTITSWMLHFTRIHDSYGLVGCCGATHCLCHTHRLFTDPPFALPHTFFGWFTVTIFPFICRAFSHLRSVITRAHPMHTHTAPRPLPAPLHWTYTLMPVTAFTLLYPYALDDYLP